MKIVALRIFWIIIVITFISLPGCDNNQYKAAPETTGGSAKDSASQKETGDSMGQPMVPHAEAIIIATYPDTAVTGTIKFESDSDKAVMMLDISIPSKAGKTVAVHIHEHGNCSDNANAAHGHWNPTNAAHGKWGSESFHAGDIGNIKLDEKGNGHLSMATELWTLGGKASTNILGKSIIVHGGMDDYKTQPSGNTGSRVGCGVIR